jgi:hypothetical protein
MSSHLIDLSVKLDRESDFYKILIPSRVDDARLQQLISAYGLDPGTYESMGGMLSYYSKDHHYPLIRMLVTPVSVHSEASKVRQRRRTASCEYGGPKSVEA